MIESQVSMQEGQEAEPVPVFFSYVPNGEDTDYAELVSEWTKGAGTMLPKSKDDILSFFDKQHSVLIFAQNGALVGHAAGTAQYSDGSVEVGSVYTHKDYRGQGVATAAVVELLKHLKAQYPDKTLFALANKMSAGLFEKLGARVMKTTELPGDVWGPCTDCPMNPHLEKTGVIFQCCDTPYDLTHIVE